MLSTQILVQSYAWTFSVHISVNLIFTMLSIQIYYKYHIYAQCSLQKIPINRMLCLKFYHIKYTDFSSILHSDTFSFHISVKSHVYHVKYADLLYNHIYAQCSLQKIPINRMLCLKFYHIKYTDISSILCLDIFCPYFCKSPVYHVKYTDFL